MVKTLEQKILDLKSNSKILARRLASGAPKMKNSDSHGTTSLAASEDLKNLGREIAAEICKSNREEEENETIGDGSESIAASEITMTKAGSISLDPLMLESLEELEHVAKNLKRVEAQVEKDIKKRVGILKRLENAATQIASEMQKDDFVSAVIEDSRQGSMLRCYPTDREGNHQETQFIGLVCRIQQWQARKNASAVLPLYHCSQSQAPGVGNFSLTMSKKYEERSKDIKTVDASTQTRFRGPMLQSEATREACSVRGGAGRNVACRVRKPVPVGVDHLSSIASMTPTLNDSAAWSPQRIFRSAGPGKSITYFASNDVAT
jgi:hypothetical protein